jgi:hypothetical protein
VYVAGRFFLYAQAEPEDFQDRRETAMQAVTVEDLSKTFQIWRKEKGMKGRGLRLF